MISQKEKRNKTKNIRNTISDFEIWVLFNTTSFAVSRARGLELAEFGLTLEQASILNTLISRGGSATYREIASSTMRQYHSVSAMVNRMDKSGLVIIAKYSNNKEFQVSITEKGLDIYKKVTRNSIEMTFSALAESDKKNFVKNLNLLNKKARNLLGLDFKHPFLP